ncbi:MAG: ATP-binding protein [Bacteroidota bacterium]
MSTQQSPFKFLDSYEKEDKDKFFGREKEVEILYERIFETKMILLYGASGVGKTSIIRCGLANKFNPPQWMDLFVRKREDINQSLTQAVHTKILQSKSDGEIPEDILDALQMLYLYNFIPIYLIFDQFEELFIFGQKEEQEQFFHFVQRLLKSELPVKILLSMREEYIAYLADFEKQVPSLFDHRIRVEKMVRTNLAEVIGGTAKAYDIGLEEPEATIEAIIDNLSDKRGVDLTNLQVYLDRLYRTDAARKGEQQPISFNPRLVAEVGELKDVLGDFLDEQLSQLEIELGKKDVPLDVLFALVTDDGTKRAQQTEAIKESLYRRKNISRDDVEFCIKRFSEMRIFKEIDE